MQERLKKMANFTYNNNDSQANYTDQDINAVATEDPLHDYTLSHVLALIGTNTSSTTTTTTSVSDEVIDNVTTSAADDWSHFYDLVWSSQGICLIFLFATLIVITIIGNTLIILAVVTTRRLRTVTNCFVMSLAVADFLVGIFVMPPAVAVHLLGSWQLGWVLCDIWISLDVLLCTASILSLCAISVDRYLAVTQPLTYSRKRRSKRLALGMILIVWVLALAITCPPILGWYEPGRRDLSECRYNRNEGYVIFSAMGSFFIPMIVMLYVYARISCVIASRHKELNVIGKQRKHKFKQLISQSELDTTNGYSLATQDLQFTVNGDELLQHAPLNGKRPTSSPSTTFAAAVATPSSKRSAAANKHNSMGVYLPRQQRSDVVNAQLQAGERLATAAPNQGSSIVVSAASHAPDTVLLRAKSTARRSRHISVGNISLKKETKTTQTLSIVVGGFVVCWLPFFVYYLLTPFLAAHLVDATVANALTWLGWFNSAINPFIYAFYSVDFRTAFCRLACKRLYSETVQQQQQLQLQQRYRPTYSEGIKGLEGAVVY